MCNDKKEDFWDKSFDLFFKFLILFFKIFDKIEDVTLKLIGKDKNNEQDSAYYTPHFDREEREEQERLGIYDYQEKNNDLY